MNKLIQELALQAKQDLADRPKDIFSMPMIITQEEFNEKFAELIVQECIGCCEQVISDPVPESADTWLNGGEQCIQDIKEHFGVTE